MGAGASAAEGAPPTLTEQEIDRITHPGSLVSRVALEQLNARQMEVHAGRKEVARMDAAFLRSQMRKRWKQHAVIVKRITCKNRKQLHRLKLNYGGPVENGGQGRDIVLDVREMLGGPYGEFIRSFFLSWLENALEYLECAISGIGCDDTMIIDVLCLATETELAELHQFLGPMTANSHALVSMRRLMGKTRKGSCFQQFLMRALEGDRPADGPLSVDPHAAVKQAQIIHESFTSTPPNYSAIFEVLCSVSRQQCGKISDEYALSYNMSLTQAVNKNFQGNIQRAVTMWMAPRADAFALALHHALSITADNDVEAAMHAVARIVGSVDKHDASSWVKDRYAHIYNEALADRICKRLTGRLKDALLGWIDEESFDSATEHRLADLVETRGATADAGEATISIKAMSPLAKMLMNDTNVRDLNELLDLAASSLRSYLSELQTSNNDENTTKGADNKNTTASAKEKAHAARAVAENTKVSRKVPDPEVSASGKQTAVDFQAKFDRMCRYLKSCFQLYDHDRSGSLNTTEFWELISNLNLGFTGHEIEGMQAWCDWDNDGTVSYAESVNELADHVLTTMDANGQDVMAELDRLESESKEKAEAAKAAKREQSSANDSPAATEAGGQGTPPAIPPSLNQYLYDSFQNYDTDKSGTLDMSEFWPFISSVFSHNFTDDDLEALQGAFDADGDGMVTWDEALATFTKKINEMKSDRRDVWLGLVDKASGMLFWYNLRDESSFWMNETDQERFKAFQVAADSADSTVAADYSILPAHPSKPRDQHGRSAKAGRS